MGFSSNNQETSMDEEEVKHICKFCGKIFKNVRALCGHKRSHSLAVNSTKKGHKNHEFEMGIQDNHQTSYNFERKSKEKGSHSNFCDKCDKGFKSFRALYGHMRSHSKRKIATRLLNKDLKLPNNLPREKRSVRRYKINTCSMNYYSCSNWNNFGYGTTTSSVNIVDEQELKEVASCLLMLAKGGFYSAENVSVDSELVEPSCNDNDFLMKRVKVDDFGTKSDALKSGYVSVEEVAGFLGFNSDDCKIRQEYVDCGPAFNFHRDSEFYTAKNKDEDTGIPQVNLIFDSKPCEHALEECKCAQTMNENNGIPQVGSIFGTCDHSIKETMCELSDISGPNPANNSSGLQHICKICEKGFRSNRALGGHRLHCPGSKRSFTTETKFHSQTVELRSDHRKKRAKKFICSVCCKEFGSGQALGGHMRAHFPGNSQSCEKKNDAFGHDSIASEGEIGLNHVHNPHSLPALVPVA